MVVVQQAAGEGGERTGGEAGSQAAGGRTAQASQV